MTTRAENSAVALPTASVPFGRSPLDVTDRPNELLDVQTVARLMRVPVSWVYQHTRRAATNPLPVVKLGKYVRFRLSDVEAYIEAMRETRPSR